MAAMREMVGMVAPMSAYAPVTTDAPIPLSNEFVMIVCSDISRLEKWVQAPARIAANP
ncbi:hypothetical protein [Sphingobium sp. Leaf26]|uniref:hypothetical protein n=1 Tax=Sphingobium sp. Leaf26 TaxID=1735693 RepID=UPI0012E2AA37|nr:hypothetical protein [Sphingobium sp. Leaf26]